MFDEITIYLIVDLYLLLLIGMGPKITLVPFPGFLHNAQPGSIENSRVRAWE